MSTYGTFLVHYFEWRVSFSLSRLPLRGDYPAALAANAQQLPVFMGHGDSDPVVPLQWAEVSHQAMIKEGGGQKKEEVKNSPWSGALGLKKVRFATTLMRIQLPMHEKHASSRSAKINA